MFWKRKKKKKEKKIVVNTDGDVLPVDVVEAARRMGKRVGEVAIKEAREDPELINILRQGMNARGQPGPEDVFLLYLYSKGAISPEKSLLIPKNEESETHVYVLWADDYIQHTSGNRVFVTLSGIRRLQTLGVVDGRGKILSSL